MTTERKVKLAERLKEAADPQIATRTRTKIAEEAKSDTQKFAQIEDNPFFQIARSKDAELRLPNQKRDAMIKLLSYDKTKTAEENEAMAKAYMQFLEFMEEQSLQSSKANLAGQNAKVFAELKKVIDEFSNGLFDFKTEMAPHLQRLESIHNIQLSGKALELLEEIVEDRRAIKESREILEKQRSELVAKTTSLEDLTYEIRHQQDVVATLGEDYRLGLKIFGIKGDSSKELARRKLALERATESSKELSGTIEALKSSIAATEEKLGTTRETKFGELSSDKAVLQEMLDISSEEHIAAHERLKDNTLRFIETSEERIDSVLSNVEEVNALTGKTAKRNGAMVIIGAVMNEAVKTALVNNQQTLAEFAPPADPALEDEITKAEREDTRSAVLRHIKSVTMADNDTTKLRNSLTRHNDQLQSMLQANEERIRATRQLRTSGISNMAAEMAITMTALADAANAEAIHMSQTMVDAMGQTVIDIRSKEVMRQAADMGIRNQQLADLIVATQQADRIARIGIEEQREALIEMNKKLAGVTEVTADLHKTLRDSEAVYADAQKTAAEELAAAGARVPSNDNPAEDRSRRAAVNAPEPGDIFG